MNTSNVERQHYMDWLRVLAMITIFLFHCAMYFSTIPWHVKNNQQTFAMTVFVGIVSQWIMPLFFVLSAMSIHHSLDKRKSLRFLGERFKRLIIPLLFGSLFIIAPLQVWIERVSFSGFNGSFLNFYLNDYFNGFYGFGGNFAWGGVHLWYLLVLFLYSLYTLPLFLFLRSNTGVRLTNRIAEIISKPAVIYLMALPIVAAELFVNLYPETMGRRDSGGWSMITYLIVFILGFFITTHENYLAKMEKNRHISLLLGILFMCGVLSFYSIQSESQIFYITKCTAEAFNMWLWLMAILGFGKHYMNFNNKFLQYANRAVLPFYIIHQTVIVGLGYIMVDWKLAVIIKYTILSLSSFLLIMIIYGLVVNRIKFLRFLLGMKA